MPAKQLKMSLLQVFFELPRETDSGETLALLINRHVCLVPVSVKPGFHKSQFRPRQRPILSQNKSIGGKDDCSTT